MFHEVDENDKTTFEQIFQFALLKYLYQLAIASINQKVGQTYSYLNGSIENEI